MLTPIGLFLNFIGSFILLGSDVDLVKQVVKRVDPVHRVYLIGLDRIHKDSLSEELVEEGRAYPYDQAVEVSGWSWWPIRWFLNQYVEQDVPLKAEVDLQGGRFKINGEELTLPEPQRVPIDEDTYISHTSTVTLTAAYGLVRDAFTKRIYIYGVSFLTLGFLLQLIDSLY